MRTTQQGRGHEWWWCAVCAAKSCDAVKSAGYRMIVNLRCSEAVISEPREGRLCFTSTDQTNQGERACRQHTMHASYMYYLKFLVPLKRRLLISGLFSTCCRWEGQNSSVTHRSFSFSFLTLALIVLVHTICGFLYCAQLFLLSLLILSYYFLFS